MGTLKCLKHIYMDSSKWTKKALAVVSVCACTCMCVLVKTNGCMCKTKIKKRSWILEEEGGSWRGKGWIGNNVTTIHIWNSQKKSKNKCVQDQKNLTDASMNDQRCPGIIYTGNDDVHLLGSRWESWYWRTLEI